MDTSEPVEGGCHCGAVRYAVRGPWKFQFLCHCDACSKLNGGMRLAGATVDSADLELNGQTQSYVYDGGKAKIEVRFCTTCGTPLAAFPEAYPGAAVVRANTLDDRLAFQPAKSIFTQTACAWELVLGGDAT